MKTDNEIKALLNLLDDEDENIFNSVKNELLNIGLDVLTFINDFKNKSNKLNRYQELEAEITFKELINFLNEYNDFENSSYLEELCFKISIIEYPKIDTKYYIEILNKSSLILKERLVNSVEPEEIIKKVKEYFFNELKLSGNIENYYDIDNNFLFKAIEKKKANPITLSIFIILICKRIGIKINGIGLPGHFIISIPFGNKNVFIDPFNNGNILSKEECKNISVKNGYIFNDEMLQPLSNRKIIERIFRNIFYSYERNENKFKSQMCLRCIDIVKENK